MVVLTHFDHFWAHPHRSPNHLGRPEGAFQSWRRGYTAYTKGETSAYAHVQNSNWLTCADTSWGDSKLQCNRHRIAFRERSTKMRGNAKICKLHLALLCEENIPCLAETERSVFTEARTELGQWELP